MSDVTIPYQAEGFESGDSILGSNVLGCGLGEVVHAAMTVGKDESTFKRAGRYARFEALYKLFHVKAYLDIYHTRLRQTSQFKRSDPSEKGAISYYHGLMMAKLFAEKYLDTPWLMHLDTVAEKKVFINPKGEKPDLVGLNTNGQWIVIEAKGRSGPLPATLISKACNQLDNLATIDGQIPFRQLVSAAYFRKAKGDRTKSLTVKFVNHVVTLASKSPQRLPSSMNAYYDPFFRLLEEVGNSSRLVVLDNQQYRAVHLGEADVTIGVNSELLQNFQNRRQIIAVDTWSQILAILTHPTISRAQISEMFSPDGFDDAAQADLTLSNFYLGADGIFVALGLSWQT